MGVESQPHARSAVEVRGRGVGQKVLSGGARLLVSVPACLSPRVSRPAGASGAPVDSYLNHVWRGPHGAAAPSTHTTATANLVGGSFPRCVHRRGPGTLLQVRRMQAGAALRAAWHDRQPSMGEAGKFNGRLTPSTARVGHGCQQTGTCQLARRAQLPRQIGFCQPASASLVAAAMWAAHVRCSLAPRPEGGRTRRSSC